MKNLKLFLHLFVAVMVILITSDLAWTQEIINGSSNDPMLTVINSGSGSGILGSHSAANGTAPGVHGKSNSSYNLATGVVGEITSTSPGISSAGVRGINAGTGQRGIGVWGSQAGSGWGVYGTSSTDTGVRGKVTSTSPDAYSAGVRGINAGTGRNGIGVWGSQAGSGWGVYGTSVDGRGVFGKATGNGTVTNYGGYFQAAGFRGSGVLGKATGRKGKGVYGKTTGEGSIAVYGEAIGEFQEPYGFNHGGYFITTSRNGTGVRGVAKNLFGGYGGVFTAAGQKSYGVYASAPGNASWGLYATSTQLWGGVSGETTGAAGYGIRGHGIGEFAYAGYFEGNVHIEGTLTATAKAFVHPHPKDPGKQIVYVSLEGAENGIYVRGSGKLEKGLAEIELPEHFALVAASEGLTAQITPRDGKAMGYLFVKNVSPSRITVVESGKGRSDARFDYLVMGVRSGFEEHEAIQDNSLMKPTSLMSQEEFEKWMGLEKNRGLQRLLIENGTLTSNGKIKMDTAKRLGWKLGVKTKAERLEKGFPNKTDMKKKSE